MVEMLRKLDTFATAFPLTLLMLFSVPLKAVDSDTRLEAAIHREAVVACPAAAPPSSAAASAATAFQQVLGLR